MGNTELTNYIKTAQDKKIPDEQIRMQLIQAGWPDDLVRQSLGGSTSDLPLPPKPPSHISHPASYNMWDAFEHILLFISLYVLASSIILTLNLFIDKWYPAITDKYSYYSNTELQLIFLHGCMAALIVSFPLFAFFFLHITKKTLQNPSIRGLHARKTLIYITLVGTFLILLGQIISTVYGFLSGNVTINFLLHLGVIIAVAGIIFGYYLMQIKEDRKAYA